MSRTRVALVLLAATGAQALDLRTAAPALVEVRFWRAGRPAMSPGEQEFHLIPAQDPAADWPARLAEDEARRRSRAGRRARRWAGFLGDRPCWAVDGQVLVGPREAARIRTRYELWTLVPGFLLHMRAEDPGGEGRSRAQKRTAFLMRQFTAMERGAVRDPFRAVRLSPAYRRWRETYRFRLPSGLEFTLSGPAPEVLPPLPMQASPETLFGRFEFQRTLPGNPRPAFRGLVPGYLIETTPGFFSQPEQRFVYQLLGTRAGVPVAPRDAVVGIAPPPGGEPPVAADLPALESDLDSLDVGDLDDF